MTAAGIPRIETVRRIMFAAMFLSLPLAAVPWMGSTWMVLLEMFFSMFIMAGSMMRQAISPALSAKTRSRCSTSLKGTTSMYFDASLTRPLYSEPRLVDECPNGFLPRKAWKYQLMNCQSKPLLSEMKIGRPHR